MIKNCANICENKKEKSWTTKIELWGEEGVNQKRTSFLEGVVKSVHL